MFKKLLTAVVLVSALSIHAQFTFESFEGNTLPDPASGLWPLESGTWLVSDNGVGTSQSWNVNSNIVVPPFQYHGTRAAYLNRENIGAGNTSEDWLVMPAVIPNSGDFLSFFSRATIVGNQGTMYQVRISTVSQTDQSTFVTVDGWNEDDLTTTFNLFNLKSISLDAFAGTTIYIAFVMVYSQPTDSLNGDRWVIDAVTVGDSAYSMNTIRGTLFYSHEPGCASPQPILALSNFSPGMVTNAENVYYSPNQFYINTAMLYTNITITPEPVPYFTPNPSVYTFNFTDYENLEYANFCYSPSGTHPDLEITALTELTCSTPGEHTDYVVNFQNKGTEVQSGTVTFNYDDDRMNIIEFPQEMEQDFTIIYGPGTVSISFADLQPFQNRAYHFHFTLSTPLDSPALNVGDELSFSAEILSGADETPADNQMDATFTVIGSMDPNEIRVTEGETISPSQATEFLNYQIHFQNIGTGPASNVKIVNTIEEDLDISTLEIISSSHPMSLLASGRELQFNFNDIVLTPSVTDFEHSVGYVSYRIKPATTEVGTVYSNTANIYFDYNYPIQTNTAITTVTTLGNNDTAALGVKMYPNPAHNELLFATDGGAEILSVVISNIVGAKVMSITHNVPEVLDISKLQSGTYFITIETGLGRSTKKLIKR